MARLLTTPGLFLCPKTHQHQLNKFAPSSILIYKMAGTDLNLDIVINRISVV